MLQDNKSKLEDLQFYNQMFDKARLVGDNIFKEKLEEKYENYKKVKLILCITKSKPLNIILKIKLKLL